MEMNLKNKASISETDEQKLRQAFHELPGAPENPWFHRKVMNRLPEKRISQYTPVEYLAYLLAVIGIGFGWWYYGSSVIESGVLTGHDLLALITLAVFSVLTPANFVSPLVRRWLR